MTVSTSDSGRIVVGGVAHTLPKTADTGRIRLGGVAHGLPTPRA